MFLLTVTLYYPMRFHEFMNSTSKITKLILILSGLLMLILPLIFWITYKVNPGKYIEIAREDNLIEWAGFSFFLISGFLSLILSYRIKKSQHNVHSWFFILFSLFLIFCAMEEISWGQRVMGIPSTEFFNTHSDQKEINLHNVLQMEYDFKTRKLGAWLLLFYVVGMPLMSFFRSVRNFFNRTGIFFPSFVLAPGFITAIVMMLIDRPTGFEEEYGEFLFSLGFFLFVIIEHFRRTDEENASAHPAPDTSTYT